MQRPSTTRRRSARVLAAAVTAALVAMLASPAPAKPRPSPADTVLLNGFIYTVDSRDSVAQAVAIDDGVITFVGTSAAAKKYIGAGTDVIDLEGRMVMPGIHDGHIHAVTKPARPSCDMGGGPLTVAEFQAMVNDCLDDPRFHTGEIGAPNDFLLVGGLYWQFLRPPGTEIHKGLISSDVLDNPDHRPIIVSAAVTGHNILVNQEALDLAGITSETPDPPGGVINHYADGEPNGVLQDAAGGLVTRLVPPAPPVSFERRVELAGERMQEFSREGITSFFVPGSSAGLIEVFAALQDEGGLTARAHFAVSGVLSRSASEQCAFLDSVRERFEDPSEIPLSVRSWRPGKQTGPKLVAEPGIAIDGAKMFLDGIIQYPAQTAFLSSPYLDKDGNPRTDEHAYGEQYITPEVLNDTVARLERCGYQSHIHAIGDAAVTEALDAFEYARKQNPSIRSHPTIAHAELVNPVDYQRFGRLDVTASMGLVWAKPAPDSTDAVKPYVGPERWDWYEPTAPITEGGGKVSLGSDCCLDPFDEWMQLRVAITRQGAWGPDFPEYAGTLNGLRGLTVAEGIRAVTYNGAYQMHQEKVTGSIEVGKLADLIVLNQNITQIDPLDIHHTEVLLTLVGGQIVWRDPSF